MTILVLCREADVQREISGYVRAFRRRGIELQFIPEATPIGVDLSALIDRCPELPSLILHPEAGPAFMPHGLADAAIPTALLQPDPYAYTHRRVRWAMLFDYVLPLHPGFEEVFRAAGHPAPVTLFHAVDTSYFDTPEEKRTLEVSFIGGSKGPYCARRALLTTLEREFVMNDWRREYSYAALAETYRSSKIVVNVGRDDYPTDVSLRFAEAMAAGALFLTRTPSEMGALGFEEGVHYVGFRDQAEATRLIRRYLTDESARRRIAGAAREKVLQEHTYDVRANEWLARLAKDRGRLFAPARSHSQARVRSAYLDYYAANGALREAKSELLWISRHNIKHALVGVALLAWAWAKRIRPRFRQALRFSANATSAMRTQPGCDDSSADTFRSQSGRLVK